MAKANPEWGCVGSRANCSNLGHVVSATAIPNFLGRNRIEPAPLRWRQTWTAFLRAQASAIVLIDSLSLDTVLLKRRYVLLYGVGDDAGDLVRGDRQARRRWVTHQRR